jgi:hypothetical protein
MLVMLIESIHRARPNAMLDTFGVLKNAAPFDAIAGF